jgi:glycosyltransferase involved in cell wall biosynthesis
MAQIIDQPLLTISIPTYNRSKRLDKALHDLLYQIKKLESTSKISVYISDNGSIDDTNEIINKHQKIYNNSNISFSFTCLNKNYGFDHNVLQCYVNCKTEYIWFLSDDDNIIDGAINSILDDIQRSYPNVLYYNFDQYPYDTENPLIKESNIYKNVNLENLSSISKFIASPKLTSFVLKKNLQIGYEAKEYCFNYMHTALALLISFRCGKIFHSEKFIARPDIDFLDHIDFVPFIVNDLDKTIYNILKNENKIDIYQHLKLTKVDPFLSSIHLLSLYYKGEWILTPVLKAKLFSVVVNEFKNVNYANLLKIARVIKLFTAYLYYLSQFVIKQKSILKTK